MLFPTVLASSTVLSQDVATAYGKIVRLPAFQSAFVAPRTIDVWLPEKYGKTRDRFAVLYMHDGQNLFLKESSAWGITWKVDSTLSSLFAAGEITDCIVVGIWNTGQRSSEYTPQKPFHTLPDSIKVKIIQENGEEPFSDRYLRFMVYELKPYVDAHYRVRADREHTFIMGSSKGGLISMYAAMEYPSIFAGAACISTHWPGVLRMNEPLIARAFADYVRAHLPVDHSVKFYFDYGTETLDSLYEPYQKSVDSIFVEKGYPTAMWMSRKFDGAAHDENSWANRLSSPVRFLLGK